MDLFPFSEVREKQDELIEKVEEAIDREGSVVAHAPTGLGKTAGSITPALEYAKQNDKKVFFVTPRHSQHQIAIETARKINEKHDETVSSVDLIGKSHLCEGEAGIRGQEGPDCPRHDNTFTEAHELTDEARNRIKEFKNQGLTAEEVKKRCTDVCPYQILMHMTAEADLVVADYFHIFHPGVREIVFEKAGIDLNDTIIIVDEAHNLPSRTRSLFSSSVTIPQIKKAQTEAEKFGYYREQEYLEQLDRAINRIARDKLGQTSHEETLEKTTLKEPVESFYDYDELILDLENVAEEVEDEQERSYCANVAEFLDHWNGEDKGFVRCIKRARTSGGNREIRINYSCLDPQISTKEPLNKSFSSVLMSGTLTPQQMYIDLTGLEEEQTEKVSFESPFPKENQISLVIPTLTTKYEERDDSMRQKYAWYLAKSFESVDGNCGVFFPSYSMMYKVKELLETRTDRKLFIEDRSMDKEEKQEVLDDFAARKGEKDSVLLGVAAGSFGEGVDYPGEVLKGVFVVGLPLQRPDLETKELIDFYDELFGKGWDYGYSYPAMNRAIQAAGRCIRSKTDEGVIVYMDKRYDWSNYRKVFPPGTSLKSTKAPWKEIEEFF
ncbi:MAG: ATP-dependent DNA helicase [Nanohaloarchaea archaeon]|nr:ATP-dependent DNA helicase [Candidatus Nanohaloarchaea archaeon]